MVLLYEPRGALFLMSEVLLYSTAVEWAGNPQSFIKTFALKMAQARSGSRRVGSNRLFQALDLYWRSPEPGDSWYKSKELSRTICSHSEACSDFARQRAVKFSFKFSRKGPDNQLKNSSLL